MPRDLNAIGLECSRDSSTQEVCGRQIHTKVF